MPAVTENPHEVLSDFYITDPSGERVLWVTRRASYWEVHRYTLRGDSVNMGRSFTDAGVLAVIKFYAEHNMARVPWDNVKNMIPKWARL